MKKIMCGGYTMKAYGNKCLSGFFFAVLLSLALSSPAHAFFFEAMTGEEGIAITYDINWRLKGEIEITQERPWEITILDLLSFQLSITSIDPAPQLGPPVVNLHYSLKASYPLEIDQAFDFPLPFGKLGIETERWDRSFAPVDESNQIDISILSTVNTFQYGINLNFGEIFSDYWEGKATFLNSKITEEVIIDTGALSDLLPPDLFPAEIPNELKWEITLMPIFTIGSFTLSLVKLDTFHDGSLISSIPEDIPALGEFLPMLPVPLLKGNMHFWFNSATF